MEKKRSWEREYDKYINGEMDKIYNDLNSKLANKSITKEEYKQMQKIEKVKGNISKVTNILELKTKLVNKLDKLRDEKKKIEMLETNEANVVKSKDDINKIDEELAKLDEQKTELKNKLKNQELSADEKTKLESELAQVDNKINDNNKKFANIQESLKGKENISNKEKLEAHKVNIEKDMFEISSKISKVNMVGNNLMKGVSWDTIDLKLENWKDRKFTSKEKVTDKVKSKEKVEKINDTGNVDLSDKIQATTQEILKDEEKKEENKTDKKDEKENDEEKSLQEVSEFEKKHPRLAKIGRWFKDKFNKIRGKKNKEEKAEKEESKIDEKVEQEKADQEEEQGIDKNELFRQYLKDVAEKGMKQTAREKLDAAKEKSYAERAAKDAEWKSKNQGDISKNTVEEKADDEAEK